MSEISGNIYIKGRLSKNKNISLYGYADDLYYKFTDLGIIERMQSVPQLGSLKVKKQYAKTRYDYFFLQVYLHKIIQQELRKYLKYSYTNKVNISEFYDFDYMSFIDRKQEIENQSFSTLIQMLIILSNIGFFNNTFAASFAAIKISKNSNAFRNLIEKELCNERSIELFQGIIDKEDYFHFSLVNALIILRQCSFDSPAIVCAYNLIYSYLNKEKLSSDSKLRELFDVYRAVRGIAYMAYDLPVANIPLSFDLDNKSSLCVFLREYLDQYNDNTSVVEWSKSVAKLLNDTLYCECSVAIKQYQLVMRITKAIEQIPCIDQLDYYRDFIIDKNSVFNHIETKIAISKLYSRGVLKLTYSVSETGIDEKEQYDWLVKKLTHTNSVVIGCYYRHNNNHTILIKIKENCKNKRETALRVLHIVISSLQSINGISNSDIRYLLAVKFFLYYLLGENEISIEPTIDHNICVLCDRGKTRRVNAIKALMDKMTCGDDTQKHEIEHLISCLECDPLNDTAISIVGSIRVKDWNIKHNKDIHEFDGMVVFPMRNSDQILFLEAKTNRKGGRSKKCLKEKLDHFDILYDEKKMERRKHDTSIYVTV